jgi:phospholipase A1
MERTVLLEIAARKVMRMDNTDRLGIRPAIALACLILSVSGQLAAAELESSLSTTTPPAALQEPSALEQRIRKERLARENEFVLTPHMQNYILPLTFNWDFNEKPFGPAGDQMQPVEVKFQFSFKAGVADDLFGDNGDLYVAYTQLSLWQAYNAAISSPFRETNYEPEAFLVFGTDVRVAGLRNRLAAFGIVHQSNGQSGTFSRSWNRVYAQFVLDHKRFMLSIKPWYRLREDMEDDNNPDIGRFLGPGEVRAFYEWKKYVLGLMVRNNFRRDDQKGAVQLEGSFPLSRRFKGYVQYFYGYGETLLDYNARTNRLGVGILLTDWL